MELTNTNTDCICPKCGELATYVVDFEDDGTGQCEIGDNFYRTWTMFCRKCQKNFCHLEKYKLVDCGNFMEDD